MGNILSKMHLPRIGIYGRTERNALIKRIRITFSFSFFMSEKFGPRMRAYNDFRSLSCVTIVFLKKLGDFLYHNLIKI
jgi:hypothetical protein